jgi:hypothetical protein
VKYPDVSVELTGRDGNAFFIIGRIAKELKLAGYKEAADQFTNEAIKQPSYDHLLRLCMEWVNVS